MADEEVNKWATVNAVTLLPLEMQKAFLRMLQRENTCVSVHGTQFACCIALNRDLPDTEGPPTPEVLRKAFECRAVASLDIRSKVHRFDIHWVCDHHDSAPSEYTMRGGVQASVDSLLEMLKSFAGDTASMFLRDADGKVIILMKEHWVAMYTTIEVTPRTSTSSPSASLSVSFEVWEYENTGPLDSSTRERYAAEINKDSPGKGKVGPITSFRTWTRLHPSFRKRVDYEKRTWRTLKMPGEDLVKIRALIVLANKDGKDENQSIFKGLTLDTIISILRLDLNPVGLEVTDVAERVLGERSARDVPWNAPEEGPFGCLQNMPGDDKKGRLEASAARTKQHMRSVYHPIGVPFNSSIVECILSASNILARG